MASTKKKSGEKKVVFREPPVTSYPYVRNRVLIIDWASLSYHKLYSLITDSALKKYGVLTAEDELKLWRNRMVEAVISYVRLFNPMHIVFCLEGKRAWRKDFVREYYSKHTTVYFDKTSYYVVSDNYAYVVNKVDDGYSVVRLLPNQYQSFTSLKHYQLGELPIEKQNMLWGIATPKGDPIIPSYKGTRKYHEWKFAIDKKYWMEYKETFAVELAPIFRARAVQLVDAEGDDVIYGAVKKFAGSSDDVIVITRDSDMSQIDVKNVRIFNHQTDTFVNCDYPQQYLDAKVLSGDSSDNINGMAFVNKKDGSLNPTKKDQLAEAGALALLENCPNIYEVAKRNGWDDQYMRNRTLIDLSQVPYAVSNRIAMELDKPEPELGSFAILESMEIHSTFIQMINQMKSIGFYSLLTEDAVKRNPDIFKIGIAKDMHQAIVKPQSFVKTEQRITSDSFVGVFDVPDDLSPF